MSRELTRPPRLASWLLRRLLPGDAREFVTGDLEEEFRMDVIPERGLFRARLWFWAMASRSLVAFRRGRGPSPGGRRVYRGGRSGGAGRDVRIAARTLARRPLHSSSIVVTLALSMGATTAIFSVVYGVLLRGLPYVDADRLVVIRQATPRNPVGGALVTQPDFEEWRAQSRTIEAMATYAAARPTLTGLGEPQVVEGGRVSEDFFSVFRAAPVLGRAFTAEEAAPGGARVVVVGHAFWRDQLGGDPGVLGRALTLDGEAWQVIGVAPAGFSFPAGAWLWVPEKLDPAACGRGCVNLSAIGRLAVGVTLDQARSELAAISSRLAEAYPETNTDLVANPIRLQDTVVGSARRGLWVLLGAVGMVLLIACANVGGLLLASGTERQGEVAVRKALGASSKQLVAQMLTESALLSLSGTVLGVALAIVGLDVLRTLGAGSIPRLDEVELDGVVLGFTAVVSVLSTLLFGLAPALSFARRPVAGTLHGAVRGSAAVARTGWSRSGAIVVQVALSVMLLLGTGLLLRSLLALRTVDLGFDAEYVETFTISLPASRYPDPAARVRFHAQYLERLRALPGVTSAGGIAGLPLSSFGFFSSLRSPDLPDDADGLSAFVRIVTPGYFETLRIPVLRGRGITAGDATAAVPVVVLGRALAERLWPAGGAIGKQLEVHANMGGLEAAERSVVGVVADVRSVDLDSVTNREIYIPLAQSGSGTVSYVLRRAAGAPSTLPGARAALRELDPLLPVRRQGELTEEVAARLAAPRFYFALLGLFAALAVVLSVVGLYGLVAFQVATRRREIGIRVAIGARPRDVVRLMAGKGVAPALVGLVAGLTGAWLAMRVLSSMLFDVTPQDVTTWVAVAALMLSVVLAAAAAPARRASRISPDLALRGD